eukprot:TRINITY_DN3859_c0_g2_i2.p1 TRINITY_DN3859_c0_g2~~TRINITY_DN3859_c0_g2_i2.p1  ORF type:complete len:137 (-),score=37.68 TRINITY_DN3859_c0_g2_i2:135-545(-)
MCIRDRRRVHGAQPYTTVYSATKAFDDFFSRALALEMYQEKVDVLTLRPFYVTTPMSAMKTGFDTITADDCVRAALGKAGYDVATYGHINHSVQGYFIEKLANLPHTLQGPIWRVFGRDVTITDKKRIAEYERKRK